MTTAIEKLQSSVSLIHHANHEIVDQKNDTTFIEQALFSASEIVQNAIAELKRFPAKKPTYPPFRGDVSVCEAWLERHMKGDNTQDQHIKQRFFLTGSVLGGGVWITHWKQEACGPFVLYFTGNQGERNPTRNRIIALGEQLKYEFKNTGE